MARGRFSTEEPKTKIPLNVGDTVKYVESGSTELKRTREYIVSSIRYSKINHRPIGVHLRGHDGWWYFHRFRLVRSVHTCVACMQPLPSPAIVIKGNTVAFGKGEITVGCTAVTNAQVRAIAERLVD